MACLHKLRCHAGDFASADASRGLSARPRHPFGVATFILGCQRMLFFGEPILGQPKISSFRAFAVNRTGDEVAGNQRVVRENRHFPRETRGIHPCQQRFRLRPQAPRRFPAPTDDGSRPESSRSSAPSSGTGGHDNCGQKAVRRGKYRLHRAPQSRGDSCPAYQSLA